MRTVRTDTLSASDGRTSISLPSAKRPFAHSFHRFGRTGSFVRNRSARSHGISGSVRITATKRRIAQDRRNPKAPIALGSDRSSWQAGASAGCARMTNGQDRSQRVDFAEAARTRGDGPRAVRTFLLLDRPERFAQQPRHRWFYPPLAERPTDDPIVAVQGHQPPDPLENARPTNPRSLFPPFLPVTRPSEQDARSIGPAKQSEGLAWISLAAQRRPGIRNTNKRRHLVGGPSAAYSAAVDRFFRTALGLTLKCS